MSDMIRGFVIGTERQTPLSRWKCMCVILEGYLAPTEKRADSHHGIR
jgi:hypothetical protein